MRAAILNSYNKNGNELEIRNIPVPDIDKNEVLVRISTAGVNPLDNMIIRGEVKLIVPYKLPLIMLSFLAKSYSDAPRFTAYIITPMSFLCNTFFSTTQMPNGFRQIIGVLPLSQASAMIRSIANGGDAGVFGFAVLISYLVIFGLISVLFIYRKKNL